MIYCGIDIGTTNTKGALLDPDGELIDTTNISTNQSDSDSKSIGWYDSFCSVLDYFSSKGHFSNDSIACSVTAQGGSFVLLDKKFNPVSRIYSWTEAAGANFAQSLIDSFGIKGYYHITGWQPGSWLMACKLKELISNKQIPETARHIATAADFIHSQIAGKFITDITAAQITGLCDFQKSAWNEKIVNWAGIDSSFLPRIANDLSILCDNVQTKWGKVSFTTSSHDQYAAMQAAGLKKDTEAMLATGTAWVINARNSQPAFDDNSFMTHPGRDLFADCFGNIIIAASDLSMPIGKGLDDLLARLDIDTQKLAQMEKDFGPDQIPAEAIDTDLLNKEAAIQNYPASLATRRYMEATASLVAFLFEQFQPARKNGRVVMTGGAVASSFWPQVIADLCATTVEAINFPEFTAYGAALHAKSAFEGKQSESTLLETAQSRSYKPAHAERYRRWYEQCQKPVFAKKILAKKMIKP